MKVMLVIPMHYYKAIIQECAVLWPEYKALNNGIIVHSDTAGINCKFSAMSTAFASS